MSGHGPSTAPLGEYDLFLLLKSQKDPSDPCSETPLGTNWGTFHVPDQARLCVLRKDLGLFILRTKTRSCAGYMVTTNRNPEGPLDCPECFIATVVVSHYFVECLFHTRHCASCFISHFKPTDPRGLIILIL